MASLTLLSSAAVFTGCGEPADDPGAKETLSADTNTESDTGEVDNRFANVNYGGREFNIYTSTHQASTTMDNSNFLIEGDGKSGGSLVNDAVFKRNVTVEEQLGVKLVFTQCDLSYGAIAGDIRIFTQSGDHEFDLVINDIYDYAQLVIEGHFNNVLCEESVFDFDRNYWYKDYMEDLRLIDGYQYILAGDYFADVLRTAHLLLVNKDLYNDYYRKAPDELYDMVSNYEWTYDQLITLITGLYVDRDQSGSKTEGDQFGYVDSGFWGASIPASTSGMTSFITRDEEGIPTLTVHEGDRANQLAEKLTQLFNNESSAMDVAGDPLNAFVQGTALVGSAVSLGSLESQTLRQMESDAAVLPYPMLFASDRKYITATHDTTEMGAILRTAKDMAFTTTVIEVLNRETANIVIPKYYKESLQVQCVDDEKAAAMIDIIHDNFDNAFVLAYNHTLGDKILQAFSHAAEEERQYSAVFAGQAKAINKTLGNTIKKYRNKNGIS